MSVLLKNSGALQTSKIDLLPPQNRVKPFRRNNYPVLLPPGDEPVKLVKLKESKENQVKITEFFPAL